MAGRRKSPIDTEPTAHDAPAPFAKKSSLSDIRVSLLDWFRQGHRDLPWRKERDPYAIWISEIMLQQTRTETVKGYFSRFVARFPTVSSLAAAPLDDVLSLWSGLGYYSRARNLHKAAQQIRDLHHGEFPTEPAAIAALPGIGPYTAGAIRSIALGQAAPILDGNVIRVLSRLFLLLQRPETAAGKRLYWSLAELLLPAPTGSSPRNDPGDLNQSLMELGATVCLPRRPICLSCPLSTYCEARRVGNPEDYPPAKAQRAVPTVKNVSLILLCDADVLLLRRPELGLWGGLWEPPTLALDEGETEQAGLLRLGKDRLGITLPVEKARPLAPFTHVLTHRIMRFAPYVLSVPSLPMLRLDGYTAQRLLRPDSPQSIGLSAWVSSLLARVVEDSSQPGLF